MKRPILLGLALFLLCGTEAWAGRLDYDRYGRAAERGRKYYKSPTGEVHYIARGKRGRKYARRFSLRENLTGDKRRVYDEFGYTPHRLRIDGAGRITERWKYHSAGVEFHFDESGSLIDIRRFPPEDNHID